MFIFFNVLSKQLKDRVYANIGLKALSELFWIQRKKAHPAGRKGSW
ncbi:hypothetical protein B4123_2754 [Bacillus paralicheniformis]|uniref:Uncharacterized protein n=1 Tax=Bacillus paralicheniformis TaxID=1648923 RepID=A0ABY3FPV1_9BACI|nr:hypothetical protein SC10_B2orf04363 [Bacillus paralicheniformis]OLF99824.1 hypothetical protein B4125_4502 [Bacillus paralicheniformis]OLG10840.1 hypothetical protein B4123_2754 [Bacillus paralicheniformis]TWJ52262.1 hypothetical protein CHCC5023_4383 [Bacillus paralicheniformis]TWJ70830.1 hypothetical protein CHCC5019_3891 [Bacillus paralicheniformis]